jgi:hypothetical protein
VCRFEPTCSAYAHEVLTNRPFVMAIAMSASRLARCNPLVRRVASDPVTRPHPLVPRPNTMRTLGALVAVGGGLVLVGGGAAVSDDISGGCTGTINGKDAATLTRDDPLVVREGTTVSAAGSVPEAFASQNPQSITTVEVEILADVVGVTTDEHVSNGPTYTSDTVDIDDFLEYGAGLYRVRVVNRGQGWRCEYTGYLELDENPLTRPVGIAAAAGVVIGAVGVAFAKGGKRRPRRDWVDTLMDDHDRAARDDALRTERERSTVPDREMFEEATYAPVGPPCCLSALAMPLAAMPLFGTGGGGAAMSAPGPRPRHVIWQKVLWKRGHPAWGFLSGLLLGLGASVLLWQYSVWLLDVWTAIVAPVAVGIVAALVAWYGRRYRVRVTARTGDAAAET